jgi:AraC-like DNA-binding protein
LNYLYFSEIQNLLNQQCIQTSTKLSFIGAAMQLYNKDLYHTGIPVFPDFSQWDVHDLNQFQSIHDQVPVSLDNMVGANPSAPDAIIGKDFYPGHTLFPLMIPINAAAHRHNHDYFEIDFVLSGSCEYLFENTTRKLQTNDMCILSPDVSHDFLASKGCLIISINLKREVFENAFFYILKDNNPLSSFFRKALFSSGKTYLYSHVVFSAEILTVIRQIFVEFYSKKPYSNEICINYLEILFASIMREQSHISLHDEFKNSTGISTIVPALLEYISKNYNTVTLQNLADHFNYDKAYIGKLIKKYTGLHYNDVVNHYKIQRAIWLLENSKLKIEDISYKVGYNHPDYFYRCFVREMGVPPSSYRKNYQN